MGFLNERGSSSAASWSRRVGLRAGLVVGAGVGSVLLPYPAVLVGVTLLVLPVLYYGAPPFQPYVEGLLGAPIEPPGRRRVRMVLVAATGVLVIAAGSFGASMRARRMTETEQIASLRSDAEENLADILKRAQAHLEKGDVDSAALVLMSSEAIPYVESELRVEVDDLARRVYRCNDEEFVLGVLRSLSQDQLVALEAGSHVPEPLRFDHPALDRRALELAHALLDQVPVGTGVTS